MKGNTSISWRVIPVLLMVLLVLSGSVVRAECAGETGNIWVSPGQSNSETYDLSEYGNKIREIYNMFVAIAIPCGAVSVAFGAFRLLSGDEKMMAKGKRQIAMTIIAIAAIILLPLAIKEGINLGMANGWTPPTAPTTTPDAGT